MPNSRPISRMLSRMSPLSDVAELVRDDALQLVAVELLAAQPRVTATAASAGGPAGREGVDAVLVRQHVDLGHRHAGGDRHLLDHVAQPAQLRVGGVGRHQHAAQARGRPRRHRRAARGPEQRGQARPTPARARTTSQQPGR